MLERKSLITIDPSRAGLSVLDMLSARFTYHDRAAWSAELAEGRLKLNGMTAKPDDILKAGDCLEYVPRPRPEPPVDTTVSCLLSSDNWAFLSKSGNLPCHPAGCFFNHTLWALLKTGAVPGLPPHDDIHFVSRLDRETSGLLLVAWDAQTARRAAQALAQPATVKEYRVLVEGAFPDVLDATGYLWSRADSRIAKKRYFSSVPPADALRPETASTRFRKVGESNGISELSAILTTGRTHQIRATLSSLGFPVVGDKLYGVDETCFLRFIDGSLTSEDRARLRMPRQALHAYRMTVDLGGGPVTVTAPLTFPPVGFPPNGPAQTGNTQD